MQGRVIPVKPIAYGGLAVASCMVIGGAATSSDLFEVCAIAVGFFFIIGWAIGEVVSRVLLRPATIRTRLFPGVCAIVVIGALIYGALDTGFQSGRSPTATWLVSIGLIVLSLSAVAMPFSSTRKMGPVGSA